MNPPITDFHELDMPHTDTPNVPGETEDWCTSGNNWADYYNVKGVVYWYYLLNDGSLTLCSVKGIKNKDIYFKTEEKCHEHAAAYYKKHGKDYPYMLEWIAASGIFADDDESQVMEFI